MASTFTKIRRNAARTATAALHQEGNAYVVTLWTEATDRIVVVGQFDWGRGLECDPPARAAQARALAARDAALTTA
jgi:hypothetical protein